MKTFFIYLILLIFFIIYLPSLTRVLALTNNRPTHLHNTITYGFTTPTPVISVRRGPVKKQSLVTKIWSTIAPGVLGSAGVIAGSAIAWYTLRKKKKTFNTYYEQIKEAQRHYIQTLQSVNIDKAEVKSSFKKELTLIQEDAELNAAQKKLDQEQLIAIINKVKRMMDEII